MNDEHLRSWKGEDVPHNVRTLESEVIASSTQAFFVSTIDQQRGFDPLFEAMNTLASFFTDNNGRYETMMFEFDVDLWEMVDAGSPVVTRHYATEEEARAGHAECIEWAEASLLGKEYEKKWT